MTKKWPSIGLLMMSHIWWWSVCFYSRHVFAQFAFLLPSWRYVYIMVERVFVCLSRFCLFCIPPSMVGSRWANCYLASPTIESLLWSWWMLTVVMMMTDIEVSVYMLIRFAIIAVSLSVCHKIIISPPRSNAWEVYPWELYPLDYPPRPSRLKAVLGLGGWGSTRTKVKGSPLCGELPSRCNRHPNS